MNRGLCGVLGAAAGAVVTFSLMTSGASIDAPAPSGGGVTPPATSSGAPRSTAVDLQPVLDRIDALQREVAQLSQQRGFSAFPSERIEVAGGSPRDIDVHSVIAAFDEVERRKLEGMTAEDLIRSARQLRTSVADRPQAIRRLEVALTRDITDDRRAEVMTMLGVWHRELKTPQRLAASARSFEAVIDRHGLASEYGQAAAYQLIWTASAQKNPQRGLELARLAMQAVGATDESLMKARYAEAVMIAELGNKEQARAAYTRVLSELKSSHPELQWIAKNIEANLARL